MRHHLLARNILRSDRCRAILGLSEIAANLAKQQFSLEGENAIADKISVFRGGFYEGPEKVVQRRQGDPLKLLFVGNDYLRKGLIAAGLAVIELLDRGVDVEFEVISNLDLESYIASPDESTEALLDELRRRPQVNFLGVRPYAEVMVRMAQANFLLLPTLDESLGWGPIEAAMNQTPTITTNIFAIPEFVRSSITGEIIELPVDTQTSRWIGIDRRDQHMFWQAQYALAEQLVDRLCYYMDRADMVSELGRRAQEFAVKMYSVTAASQRIADIYRTSL